MERKVGLKEGKDYLGNLGNANILSNHVKYFEKKLKKEISPYKDIDVLAHSMCHNFAAWPHSRRSTLDPDKSSPGDKRHSRAVAPRSRNWSGACR